MPAAVTFDFHNTLIRCDRWFDLEVRDLPLAVGAELGLDPDPAVVETYRSLRRDVIGHGREVNAVDGVILSWRQQGFRLGRAEVGDVIDRLMADLVAESQLLDGVAETLAVLSDHDVPLGIVSSAVHHDFLEWSLTHHGVREHFATVITSARAGYYKSRPEIYSIAFGLLGADVSRSIHIGDSYRFDHIAGSAVGLRTIWLNESGEPAAVAGPPPNAEVRTMRDAGAAILSLLEMPIAAGSENAD